MPPTWFTPEMFPLLEVLVKDCVVLDRISAALKKVDPGEKKFGDLVKIQCRMSEEIAKISTKLKLTPQSRHNSNSANKATKEAVAARQHKRPWDHGKSKVDAEAKGLEA